MTLAKQLRQPPEQVTALAAVVLADLDAVSDSLVETILEQDPSYGVGRTSREDLRPATTTCSASCRR